MMLRSRVVATSIATRMANNNRLQRRGFFNYLINYPDKVSVLAYISEVGGGFGSENESENST
jgi:hypothetical protein